MFLIQRPASHHHQSLPLESECHLLQSPHNWILEADVKQRNKETRYVTCSISYHNKWSHSSGIIDSCLGSGWRHNAPHPTAKINKVKDLALIFWSVYLIKISSSVKNLLNKRFATYFFTHIHLMIGLSSMVNLTAVMTRLLAAKIKPLNLYEVSIVWRVSRVCI